MTLKNPCSLSWTRKEDGGGRIGLPSLTHEDIKQHEYQRSAPGNTGGQQFEGLGAKACRPRMLAEAPSVSETNLGTVKTRKEPTRNQLAKQRKKEVLIELPEVTPRMAHHRVPKERCYHEKNLPERENSLA